MRWSIPTWIIILLIIAIIVVAYFISTNPYNQAKRDKVFMGNESADILIVEFGNYLDPLSAQSEVNMVKLRSEYNVKFIYKHYPSSGLSILASHAAECAHTKKRFEEMHTLLYENYANISSTRIDQLAAELGLKDNYDYCMDNKLYETDIDNDLKLAERLDIETLPVVFINGQRFDGLRTYSVYSDFIEQEQNA